MSRYVLCPTHNVTYDVHEGCVKCELTTLRQQLKDAQERNDQLNAECDKLVMLNIEYAKRAEQAELDAQTAKDGLESAARLLEQAEADNKVLREALEKANKEVNKMAKRWRNAEDRVSCTDNSESL